MIGCQFGAVFTPEAFRVSFLLCTSSHPNLKKVCDVWAGMAPPLLQGACVCGKGTSRGVSLSTRTGCANKQTPEFCAKRGTGKPSGLVGLNPDLSEPAPLEDYTYSILLLTTNSGTANHSSLTTRALCCLKIFVGGGQHLAWHFSIMVSLPLSPMAGCP